MVCLLLEKVVVLLVPAVVGCSSLPHGDEGEGAVDSDLLLLEAVVVELVVKRA